MDPTTKAGVDVPPLAIIGVPLAAGVTALLIIRARRATPTDVEVAPA